MPDTAARACFTLLNEIGIIAQLSRAAMEARLPEGLLLPHFSVVNHVTRLGGGQTPLELARAFQVPKTTMTHTLSVLERRGLIRFAPNPDDGRSKCVWLTEAGEEFREQAITNIMPVLEKLASETDPEGLPNLIGELAAIRKFLDENRD